MTLKIYRILWLFPVLLVLLLDQASAQTRGNQVACETIGSESWTHVGPQKTCYIKVNTWINSTSCTILTVRETVTGLSFWQSKKIYFLPIKVDVTFPNLITYGANGCSIKTIYKDNFKNLGRMKRLDLGNNQIESVPTNAFEDCVNLEWLQFGEKT